MTVERDARKTWLEQERRIFSDAASVLRAGQEQFEAMIARVSAHVAHLAQNVEAKQAVVELRPRPPVDLDASLRMLAEEGPDALSSREARALVSHPDRVSALDAKRVLEHAPELLRHLVRAVLSNWYQYCGQSWGADYLRLMCELARGSGIPVLEMTRIGAERALSRADTSGAAQLGSSLPQEDILELHSHLKSDLGLRDSWIYTGQVLVWWLTSQVDRGRSLDGALAGIRADSRLRALMLPPRAANTNAAAGVRIDNMVHARSVAALLRGAFGTPPLLSRTKLSELVEDVMHSDFNDPRVPPLSEGWKRVRMLAEEPFRRLLATLSEQDLEVFFSHAMNEPDRRKFWLRYLPSIERTGCVLDGNSQEILRSKLRLSPELQGAIERSFRFRHSSSVQAFFLVFANIVVVEFSVNGNAAYVYEREYFEQKLEGRIRAGRCDGVGELKLQFHNLQRFGHHSGWQGRAEQWLSEQGVHARRGR